MTSNLNLLVHIEVHVFMSIVQLTEGIARKMSLGIYIHYIEKCLYILQSDLETSQLTT